MTSAHSVSLHSLKEASVHYTDSILKWQESLSKNRTCLTCKLFNKYLLYEQTSGSKILEILNLDAQVVKEGKLYKHDAYPSVTFLMYSFKLNIL